MDPTMFDKAREALSYLAGYIHQDVSWPQEQRDFLRTFIGLAEAEIQEWTDAASDNGTALDLACDQLAAMGHEEGRPEFMEDWRDLFMGQVAGAEAVIRDALNNCAGDEDDRCFYAENGNPNKVAACPCDLPCEERSTRNGGTK